MRSALQDMRFAVRALRRRRTFAIVAIATIALGIGAATSIYSVVDGVLLRPLPFREPGRLVGVWRTFPEWRTQPVLAERWNRIPLSFPEYRALRDKATTLSGVAIWLRGSARLAVGATAEDALAEVVPTIQASSTLLDVLGVRPRLGRMYLAAEDVPNGPGVALIGDETWRRRYGRDAGVLGRVIHLDGRPYTIIGVLPPGFTVGRTRERDGDPSAFLLPAGQTAGSDYDLRGNHNYDAVARLASGVRAEEAAQEAAMILGAEADQPNEGTRLVPWHEDQTREARAPLLVLLAAVGLLLLIACVNVATLLLGEAASRTCELAARAALGASRGRIVRQLLTESLVLAVAGGVLGAALAWAGTRTLVALAPPDIPGLDGVRMDVRVLGVAFAVVVATGLFAGLLPAVVASRADASAVLHGAPRHRVRGRSVLQRALVGGEVALSVVLLIGAGLLLRSLDRLTAVDPGFRAAGVLVVETSLPRAIADGSGVVHPIYDAALAEVAALPGVRAAAAGTRPPFTGGPAISGLEIEGEAAPSAGGERRRSVEHRTVTPGYFATLGIPLLAGRDFSPADRAGAPDVVVVSEALARREFPSGTPIGKRVRLLGELRTIVGVVGDVRHARLADDAHPAMYLPAAQRDPWTLSIVVRVAGERARDAAALAPAIRRALAVVDPRLTVVTATPMQELLQRSFAEERYRAMLMSLFGALAGLLAAVGTYGVSSRAVAHRTREIGIRLAVGATPRAVVRQMVGHTLVGVGVGVAAGLALSAAAGRALMPFLFGVDAGDPVTYAGVTAMLAVVSLGASWIPARRAGRSDVMRVLRET